jgi:hypothetical protein
MERSGFHPDVLSQALFRRPRGNLRARIEAKFVENMLHVRVYRSCRHNERFGNFPVC